MTRGWRNSPPRKRMWAIVWTGEDYAKAQWEPRLGHWAVVTTGGIKMGTRDTPWHPLPRLPDGAAGVLRVSEHTHALEDE